MKALLIATIAAAMAFPVLADTELARSSTPQTTPAPIGAAVESKTITTVPAGTAIESTTTTTTSTSQRMEEAASKEEATPAPAVDSSTTTEDQQRMDQSDMQSEEKDEFVPGQTNGYEDEESEDDNY